MDLQESAAIGLQRAIHDREVARSQLAEANTKIMMLRAVVVYFRDNVLCDYDHLQVYDEMRQMVHDALNWTAEEDE